MNYINKVTEVSRALARVTPGTRLMLGEFVGAGEPACCIEALLAAGTRDLTLIANTPGLRGGFLKAKLFEQGQISQFIGTHVGTTEESTRAYLAGDLLVEEFFPMGTWAEKVRAGAVGLGGVLVPGGGDHLDITQEELGLLSGLSRQVANQGLKQLEQEALIRVEYGGITVLDLPRLRCHGD